MKEEALRRDGKYYYDCIKNRSFRTSDGVLTRGIVDKVMCRICRQERWDDGRKCVNPYRGGICDAYQNPLIGMLAYEPRRLRE